MFQLANILNLVGRPRADEAGRCKACSAISRTRTALSLERITVQASFDSWANACARPIGGDMARSAKQGIFSGAVADGILMNGALSL
jgi:hypothetical protein